MKNEQTVRSPQDLGGIIARVRRQRGLSQRQLASDFGVTQAWLSRVERGQQKAWIGQVFRLSHHLGIELTAGFSRPEEPSESEKKPAHGDYPNLDTLV